MKKIVLFGLFVLSVLFVVGCLPQEVADAEGSDGAALAGQAIVGSTVCSSGSCKDTDCGKDYAVKGTVSGPRFDGRTGLTFTDLCVYGSTTKVTEGYCATSGTTSGRWYQSTYDCALQGKICRNGACVTPPAVCGNGVKEETEGCDSGSNNGVACTAGYGSSCTYCSSTCQNIELQGPWCGDGTINGAEGCDDSNTADGDGCSSTCTVEPTVACTEGTYQTSTDGTSVIVCSSGEWVDATCEDTEAEEEAEDIETEFCGKVGVEKISDICVGDTKLASTLCNDPTTASECCQTPLGTVFTNSCDGRFLLNTTTSAQCGGVSETRTIRIDCTEIALALGNYPYSPHNASTCTSLVGYDGYTTSDCASCGYSKCRSAYGQEFISKNCYSGSTFVEFVTGDGCDLTASCTETDGGNVPGTAGSVTMTLSDARSNRLSDSCSSARYGTEYYCRSTSDFKKEDFYCTTSQNCLEGACVTPTSCTDDGLANDKAVLNSVTLKVGDVDKVVNDRCIGTSSVLQVSCSGNTYVESNDYCATGTTCTNGVCS